MIEEDDELALAGAGRVVGHLDASVLGIARQHRFDDRHGCVVARDSKMPVVVDLRADRIYRRSEELFVDRAAGA